MKNIKVQSNEANESFYFETTQEDFFKMTESMRNTAFHKIKPNEIIFDFHCDVMDFKKELLELDYKVSQNEN